MHKTWIVELYNAGERAFAFEVITGPVEPLLGDVFDGPAWLVRLLIAPLDDLTPSILVARSG